MVCTNSDHWRQAQIRISLGVHNMMQISFIILQIICRLEILNESQIYCLPNTGMFF